MLCDIAIVVFMASMAALSVCILLSMWECD